MKFKILILIIIYTSLLFSCKESACNLTTKSVLKIGFYTIKNNTETLTPFDSLTIYGIGKEGNLLYNASSNINSVFIPLSQNQDISSFVINTKGTLDTLSISYTRHLQLVSKECGFSTIFEISNVNLSKNRFNSFKIINPTIDTEYEENIRIYF